MYKNYNMTQLTLPMDFDIFTLPKNVNKCCNDWYTK